MYKCGWQGCEKAYGTLNHLNAHVTMQGHGQKRTPEGQFFVSSFSGLRTLLRSNFVALHHASELKKSQRASTLSLN